MIVGTEGPEDQVVEAAEGTSDTKADNAKTTAAAGDAKASDKPVAPASGGGSTGTGNGGSKGGGASSPGTGNGGDDPDPILTFQQDLATANAMKALESPTNDLFSDDKKDARDKINTAYNAALGARGDLRGKFDTAHDKFDGAASAMLPKLPSFLALFGATGPVGTILGQRKTAGDALSARMGANEKASADAQAATKQWASGFADWSAPSDRIAAILSSYADKIDGLKTQALGATSPNAAMLSFWLEVAPKHLQLTDRTLSADAQTAVGQVGAALKPYGLDALLVNGKTQGNGALYILGTDETLEGIRKNVLKGWTAAAIHQGKADGQFKVSPDDSTTYGKQRDTLKDDLWLAQAKKQPLDPSA